GAVGNSVDDRSQMHEGRHDCHFDIFRQVLQAQTVDQLGNAGTCAMHLPVTCDQGAAHAKPRRPKWAQMLLKPRKTGKRNQAHSSATSAASASACRRTNASSSPSTMTR